jgi:hypothetical protein
MISVTASRDGTRSLPSNQPHAAQDTGCDIEPAVAQLVKARGVVEEVSGLVIDLDGRAASY